MSDETQTQCPICGGSNDCAMANGRRPEGCWCTRRIIPAAVLSLVPLKQRGKACICEQCASQHATKRGTAGRTNFGLESEPDAVNK